MPGHGKPPSFAFRPESESRFRSKGYRGRERRFLKYRRAVVSAGVTTGTRAQALDGCRAVERSTRHQRKRYSQSSPAGLAADLTRFITVPGLHKKYFEVESLSPTATEQFRSADRQK